MLYTLRNVLIYDGNSNVSDKPYFALNVQSNNNKLENATATDYKVSIGFLLEHNEMDDLLVKLSKEKVAYERLQDKVYEAINDLNPSLREFAPTILFRILYIYGRLVDIDYEQDYILGSEQSLRIAKPLAGVYKILKDEERWKVSGKDKSRRSEKSVMFNLGGKEFYFADTDFVDWILKTLEKAITHSDHPSILGDNMLELADALYNGHYDRLEALASHEGYNPIIEHSRFLTSFCLNVHKYICLLTKSEVNTFNTKQTRFYRRLLDLFKVPGWDRYALKESREVDKRQAKRNNDAFAVLLKRGMSDMVAVI